MNILMQSNFLFFRIQNSKYWCDTLLLLHCISDIMICIMMPQGAIQQTVVSGHDMKVFQSLPKSWISACLAKRRNQLER